MSQLAQALLAELEPDDLAELAARLAPYLPERNGAEDRWFNSADAADYLGISTDGLHRLTASRRIPFTQERPGGRCYFRRADLDAWRGATS